MSYSSWILGYIQNGITPLWCLSVLQYSLILNIKLFMDTGVCSSLIRSLQRNIKSVFTIIILVLLLCQLSLSSGMSWRIAPETTRQSEGASRKSWWRHQMETFSALLAICAGNSPVPNEFPAQKPETRSFDVLFDLRPKKRLSKQWWGWWLETPPRPLWRYCNVYQFFNDIITIYSQTIFSMSPQYTYCRVYNLLLWQVWQWIVFGNALRGPSRRHMALYVLINIVSSDILSLTLLAHYLNQCWVNSSVV